MTGFRRPDGSPWIILPPVKDPDDHYKIRQLMKHFPQLFTDLEIELYNKSPFEVKDDKRISTTPE
jgi:hypothetical protein